MQIDDLAEKTGVSRGTLTTYESRGLLRAGDTVTADAESVERVHKIRSLVNSGYSLERIAAELQRDATGVRRPVMPDARAFPELLREPSLETALACIAERYATQ
jgi:DNA-binding transcriptional MerR regulator